MGHLTRSDPPLGVLAEGAGKVGTSLGPTEPKSDAGFEESWLSTLQRVSGAQFSPDDPCWDFLSSRGIVQGDADGGPLLSAKCSPLNGQRWYISLSIAGRRGEFLVDTGASHTLIGREFMSRLGVRSEVPSEGIKARTATGDAMITYGRTVKQVLVEGKTYWICPTVANITDDGILGMDFTALYGLSINARTGVLQILNPYKHRVQCVLRRESAVSSVVQRTKILPGHICDVLVSSVGVQRDRRCVMEPSTAGLKELGLRQ